MDFFDLLREHTALTLVALALLGFAGGFIDAVVGGGGLIQLPALLINFPHMPLATLIGTNKIAAISGTSVAAFQYARQVKFDLRLLLVVSVFAMGASFLGAKAMSLIDTASAKPAILFILIFIAAYTLAKKDLGAFQTKALSRGKQWLYGALIGLVIGFYDGFFGPGTGSFLMLAFVVVLGFEFLQASAYSKVINTMTNVSALFVFIRQGNFILEIAVLMAVCNVLGNVVGTSMAIRKGNRFVRGAFLVIVGVMILRYGYDVFWG
jgi:uncharacterized membrane protein YfcA